jgi:hypothetical protein
LSLRRSAPFPVSATLGRVHRLAPLLAATLCAVLLAGCGGDEQAAGPTLPRGLAADLAAQSESIADTLGSGNVCGAAQQADALLDDVVTAIQAGRVPAAFQESLTASANELVNQINCPQPDEPAPPPSEEECAALEQQKADLEEERDNTKGKGKQRKLDEQIAALEAQLQECPPSGDTGSSEGDEGDD